jgi:sec-independent protein translocase protein TatA
MGLDNPIHLAFLLLILLMIFGAKRLPEMGRSLGAGLRGFKESVNPEPTAAHIDQLTEASAVPAEMGDSSPEHARP